MMVDYSIDRFCGFCGIKIKNAVAEGIDFCPDCNHVLRKKRYGRFKAYVKKGKRKSKINDKKINRPGSLVSRVS